jgi:subtilisin family serine protease
VPGQPSRKRDLLDIGLPDNRKYKTKELKGQGVIVGIIDDGCALAHRDFLKKTAPGAPVQSRILYLWDQAGAGNLSAGWQTLPAAFPYGLELDRAAIEAALNAHLNGDLVRENAVYDHLGYRIGEVATHGTHVTDIAAGTGQSLMAIEGVAPEADIIFVQLPPPAIEEGATALWKHIKDGAAYIFARAQALNMPAVVNISYGGYDGPHDGSSALEKALDELLALPGRAVVIAAGNGFEADCHATKKVPKNGSKSLRWVVKPEDPTANDLEIWYDATSTLSVRLRPPSGAIDPAGWVQLGQALTPIRRDGKVVGYIEHLQSDTGNGGNCIRISLHATDRMAITDTTFTEMATPEIKGPAPAGTWRVDLKHVSGAKAQVHAWIWRDDAGRSRNARLRQSRFHPDDAHPAYTIAGWATGHRTISVGAYNSATNEICRYSAAGPTRPVGATPGRAKPEIYAPGEEDVRGHGVLSATALSARPRRMNGTSAAAPHVTGLIALIFDYAKNHANPPVSLTADEISTELKAEAKTNDLELNRHQAVDDWVVIKQSAVLADLVPSGKTDFTATMIKLL